MTGPSGPGISRNSEYHGCEPLWGRPWRPGPRDRDPVSPGVFDGRAARRPSELKTRHVPQQLLHSPLPARSQLVAPQVHHGQAPARPPSAPARLGAVLPSAAGRRGTLLPAAAAGCAAHSVPSDASVCGLAAAGNVVASALEGGESLGDGDAALGAQPVEVEVHLSASAYSWVRACLRGDAGTAGVAQCFGGRGGGNGAALGRAYARTSLSSHIRRSAPASTGAALRPISVHPRFSVRSRRSEESPGASAATPSGLSSLLNRLSSASCGRPASMAPTAVQAGTLRLFPLVPLPRGEGRGGGSRTAARVLQPFRCCLLLRRCGQWTRAATGRTTAALLSLAVVKALPY